MKPSLRSLIVALAAVLAPPAHAHRQWLFPSATVLSGDDAWVTFDGAISNDLFYFEHFPLRLEGLSVTAPDGSLVKPENSGTGRYRSTFDLHLTQKGTYRVAVTNVLVTASYEVGGETKRFRGTSDAFASEVPKDAKALAVSRTTNRIETFVTSGRPSTAALKPTGVGLELSPITHPNDLVAGEQAGFAFLLDGKPAAGLEVTVIAGGIRYRDKLGEIKLITDAAGRVNVTWPHAGMFWLNATFREGGSSRRGAGGPGGPDAGPAGPVTPGRRANYVATLEVLAQ
jgi:uncharacterized GH25 family protein